MQPGGGIELGRDENSRTVPAPTTSADMLRLMPLVALCYAFLLFPPEVRLSIDTLALPLYRIVIIGCAYILFGQLVRGEIRFAAPDLFVGGAAIWIVLSFMANYPWGEAAIRSGGVLIDFAGAYLLARGAVRSVADFRRFLVLVAPGLFFAGALVFLESVGRQVFWRPLFIDMIGPLPRFSEGEVIGTVDAGVQLRLGLARGFGPFSHQILAGSVLASMLGPYLLSRLRSWPKWLGILASVFGFFSLSSAAILGLILSIGMVIIDRAKALVRGINWYTILLIAGLVLLGLHIASQNGIINVLSRFTLTPSTAYYRQLIWQYAWQAMFEHPVFGIGYNYYDRPDWLAPSVDAHYLALGIRHGVAMPFMLLIAHLLILVRLGQRAMGSFGSERDIFVGMNIAVGVLFVLSMTVMFFSEANIWFMAVLGMAASLTVARPHCGMGAAPPE